MAGDSFGINSEKDESMSESWIEGIVNECNDKTMFYLRNLVMSLDQDSDESVDAESCWLNLYLLENMLATDVYKIYGFVHSNATNFHETLNTLEFVSKASEVLV